MRIGLAIAILVSAGVSASYGAAPCVTDEPECTEWITYPGSSARSLVYRSYPLSTRNENVNRALIIVHGRARNANHYFRTGMAAAFLAKALADTVVVAPRFTSADQGCNDKLAANEVSWACSADSWRSGSSARNADRLTSYDFVDELLKRLARRDVYPNLKQVVVAGHSAGGQYIARYAMANRVHDTVGLPISYVVSNPSSYAYPDTLRPNDSGDQFRPFEDAEYCTGHNRWPYGLKQRNGYAAQLSEDELRKQMATRPVTYLLGELDTTARGGFDTSCPAMAQGPNRLVRGQNFGRLMRTKYGANHKVVVVGLCGHNARCMFTADEALKILFPSTID